MDEITTINANTGVPGYSLSVGHAPITDSRLSLADLGLYMRCLWLAEVCGEQGDVDWFIREFDMPADATRAGLRRLAAAGYINVVAPEHVEARRAGAQAASVRDAAAQTQELFSESESAVIARFVALTEERSTRAAQAAARAIERELEGLARS
ncbi:hypothetical protein [Kitasatospora sp. NPDC005748]|uniref:hypothetical protein n=1 Tax=Kitasatospora sp. NPDC005748 TaxID=3157063 RepID=UPI0033F9261E